MTINPRGIAHWRQHAKANGLRELAEKLAAMPQHSSLTGTMYSVPESLKHLEECCGAFGPFSAAMAEWFAVLGFTTERGAHDSTFRYMNRLAAAAGHPGFTPDHWTRHAGSRAELRTDGIAARRAYRKWVEAGRPWLTDGIYHAHMHLRACVGAARLRLEWPEYGIVLDALCGLNPSPRPEAAPPHTSGPVRI